MFVCPVDAGAGRPTQPAAGVVAEILTTSPCEASTGNTPANAGDVVRLNALL
jgi:hypothetical protein